MRIPWLPPAVRNSLSSSYHNEPDLPMGIRAKLFAAFFAIACFGSIPLRAENPVREKQDRFSLAVECIKRFEGWHGEKRHWPYVGYGHKVLPGERLTNDITKEQGDSILRADLRKLCRMFSYLGRDSLLAAVLSYNVGGIPSERLRQNAQKQIVEEAGDRRPEYL